VLWIISLFALAVYLITVEYLDYKLQENTYALEGRQDDLPEGLIRMDRFEGRVERFETRADHIEATVDKVANTAREILKPEEKTAGEENSNDTDT
jgi:hypothetical protein